MKTPEELRTLVKETLSEHGDFRPCAWFDERLDCIRVVARDCSILERRFDGRFTVLEDNYPESGQFKVVGFTIKGARHFCESHGLDLSTPIRMAALLDAILASIDLSDKALKTLVDFVMKPLVREIDRVDVPDRELQTA